MPKKKPTKKRTVKKKPANPKSEISNQKSFDWIANDLRPLAEPMENLTLDPANARKHDEANIQSIASSLAKFGQRALLVVNRKNKEIEKGNGTYLAAQQLGWTHIAVLWVEDDPATQTGFSIADNRTAELAEWDDAQLQAALVTIEETDSDLYADLLLDSLRAAEDPEEAAGGEQPVPEHFEVVIEARDEAQQKALFERLTKEGHTCRLLTM